MEVKSLSKVSQKKEKNDDLKKGIAQMGHEPNIQKILEENEKNLDLTIT